MTAPSAPQQELATRWFEPLIPNLVQRSEGFRSDMDVVDEELLELFASEIRVAVDGLEIALNANDEQSIRHHAHTLHGMGGAAGAPEISTVGETLSAAAKSGDMETCRKLTEALRGWENEWIRPTTEDIVATESMPQLDGTILVVDDELPNRRYLEKLFEDLGATVLLAENGEQALEKIRSRRPDVALVDVMMPGINGYEVCGTITSDPELRNTAVIMVTARNSVEDIEHAFVKGAFDYIRKPFHSRELVARVRNALQLKRQNDALRLWKERMSRELEVAGALQARLFNPHPLLLPSCDLRVTYQPSEHVGGDMFDMLELPDGRVIAFVADVCGHGVASALVSTLLKGLVSEIVRTRHDHPLDELMNLLHHRFRQYVKDPEVYATLLIFRLDPETRHVEGYCCGHPLPLVFSDAGEPINTLIPDLGGMPIGLFPAELGDPYSSSEAMKFELPEGSRLFLYTDGLIEARDVHGVECGVEGLSDYIHQGLQTKKLCRHPSRLLDAIACRYRLDLDDCSLVCIQMLSTNDRLAAGDHSPTLAEAERVSSLLFDTLLKAEWPEDSATLVRLLAMEHLANVADHAGLGPEDICSFRMTREPDGCTLLFRDPGPEWDSSRRKQTSLDQMDQMSERGRGLHMIQQISRSIETFRRDNRNHTLYLVYTDIGERLLSELPEA